MFLFLYYSYADMPQFFKATGNTKQFCLGRSAYYYFFVRSLFTLSEEVLSSILK